MNDSNEGAAMREMPRYKCHKEVWALKIASIEQAPADQERMHAGGDWLLIPEDKGYSPICVGHNEYVQKHNPQPGGYYVVYDDGYKSYSPAKAFEDGYALILSVNEAPPTSIPRTELGIDKDASGEQLREAYGESKEG